METNKIPARADVPAKDKWAIQDLFATDDDWRAALAKAKEFIPRITAFRGRLAESGAALLSFFRLDDEISLAFDALVHYAQRRSDEDTRVAAYQEMVSQVTRFAVEIQSAAAFETPELLAISDEDMNRLYAEAPELKLYRLNIDRIRRRRKHVYLVNDIDLIFPLCRRIFHFLANLADVVHAVVGGCVNLNYVHASPCQNILTNGTLVAGLAVRRGVRAVDGSGKNLRRRGFPRAPCAAKQIRMGHAPRFHLIFQRSDDMLLPDDALKRLWAEFSI